MTDRSDTSRPRPARAGAPRRLHVVSGPSDPAPGSATDVDAVGASTVWLTAQSTPAGQRRGRYVPESTAHPAKMLPAIAAHAIRHYTQPGDLVLDPMCGIGTTLVEARPRRTRRGRGRVRTALGAHRPRQPHPRRPDRPGSQERGGG